MKKLMAIIVAVAMIGTLAAVVVADEAGPVEGENFVNTEGMNFGFYDFEETEETDDEGNIYWVSSKLELNAPAGGVGEGNINGWGFDDGDGAGLKMVGADGITRVGNPASNEDNGIAFAAPPGSSVAKGDWVAAVAFPSDIDEDGNIGTSAVEGRGTVRVQVTMVIDVEGEDDDLIVEIDEVISNFYLVAPEVECECELCEDCDGCLDEDCDCEECPGPCTCIEEVCTCKICRKCGGCLVEDCDCEDCPGECDCDPNPPAGVALAIIPTIVAAGAALVARKRK